MVNNQEATISVKALFDKFGTVLSNNNKIFNKDGYYDLIDENGVLVCADGERVLIQKVFCNKVILINSYSDKDIIFTLDLTEYKVATSIEGLTK